MISRALMILFIISLLPIISTSQLPTKAMVQTPSEGAKVLIDDVIQSLKYNDIENAQVHLSILKQQLSTSLESIKVLLDDVDSALKNKDINSALVHMNLIRQQLVSSRSSAVKQTNVQANHPPEAR